MKNPELEEKTGILIVFISTLMIGLGFGLLFTYKEYKEFVEVIMVITSISSFLFTTYLTFRK